MLPLKDRKGLHCWHLRRQETKIIILTMSSYTYTHTHPTQTHCLIIEPIIQRIRNAPLIRTFTFSKAIKITKRHDLNENRMTSIKTRAYPKCYLLGKSIWDSFNVLTVPFLFLSSLPYSPCPLNIKMFQVKILGSFFPSYLNS